MRFLLLLPLLLAGCASKILGEAPSYAYKIHFAPSTISIAVAYARLDKSIAQYEKTHLYDIHRTTTDAKAHSIAFTGRIACPLLKISDDDQLNYFIVFDAIAHVHDTEMTLKLSNITYTANASLLLQPIPKDKDVDSCAQPILTTLKNAIVNGKMTP